MVYGYVRVSTKDQNAARQISALMNEGVDEKNLFVDRKSGKDFQKKRYQSLLRKIKPGDVIFIKELDRLGRNYTEIIENWRLITVEKQTDIVVLDMPLLDTRKRGNNLTGRFIADLVLQILYYVAETERRNIRQRQAEGIAAANLKLQYTDDGGKTWKPFWGVATFAATPGVEPNEWTYEWSGLSKVDAAGKAIQYRVVPANESAVYKTTVEDPVTTESTTA